MSALLVIIGLSLLIVGHEFGHFFAAKLSKMFVREFGFGFPPKLFKKKIGDTEYSFNALPFGGFVRIAGEGDTPNNSEEKIQDVPKEKLFTSRPIYQRMFVIAAGVIMNFILGWILISVVLAVGIKPMAIVGEVAKGSPAEIAGIKENDIFVDFENAAKLKEFSKERLGQSVSFNILRDNDKLKVEIALPPAENENGGILGVMLGETGNIPKVPAYKAPYEGLKETVQITKDTFFGVAGFFKQIFTKATIPDGAVGPVGIFSLASQTTKVGIIYFIYLLAVISVNLAIMNMLPFPALDGGRFLFLAIEAIIRKPIPRKFEAIVNGAGLLFLLGLMVFLTVKDIGRFF